MIYLTDTVFIIRYQYIAYIEISPCELHFTHTRYDLSHGQNRYRVTAVQSTSLLTEIYYGYGKGSVYLFVTIIVASVYLTTHEGPVVE